jgi:hypothetical protein
MIANQFATKITTDAVTIINAENWSPANGIATPPT